jgi:hypothetical protein
MDISAIRFFNWFKRVDKALAFFGRVVLGILAEIAVRASF